MTRTREDADVAHQRPGDRNHMDNESGFNQRADSAAERLKMGMGLPSTKVSPEEAGGQSAPPPGSYVAQARLQAQEAEARRRAESVQQPLPEGMVAEAPPPPAQPQQAGYGQTEEPQMSQRAQDRIRELAGQRREFERRAAELEAQNSRTSQEMEELRQINHALADQVRQLQELNLNHLPDDERSQVLANIQARQAAHAIRQDVMSELSPLIGEAREYRFNLAMEGLAEKYVGFDADVHPSAIQKALEVNPKLTPEQAFRIVATDEELQISHRPRNQRVPLVLPPRGTSGATNFAPPATPSQEEERHSQLVEEREAWRERARSADPADKRAADRMLHQHLMHRLGR